MTGSWDAMVGDELSRMEIYPASSQAGLASFRARRFIIVSEGLDSGDEGTEDVVDLIGDGPAVDLPQLGVSDIGLGADRVSSVSHETSLTANPGHETSCQPAVDAEIENGTGAV